MALKFNESEIIFKENYVAVDEKMYTGSQAEFLKETRSNSSVPVNIPRNRRIDERFPYMESEYFEDDGKMVPPHTIIARRHARKMTFAVCSGNGRTLKGRDLSHVRNSILRMTGFLET